MIVPLATLLAIAAPEAIEPSLAPSHVMPTAVQWQAIAACPRVVVGRGRSFGTAVVVGHKDGAAYLLTAAHVVDNADEVDLHFFTRESHPQPARKLTRCVVLVRSENPDVAILSVRVGDQPLPSLKLLQPNERPKRFPFDAVSVGCAFGGWPTVRAESVAAKILTRTNERPVAFFWQTATKPEKGRSGGPLLTAQGQVFGLCAATQNEKGYYSHTDEIHAALKKMKYEWLWEGQ